MGVFQVLWYCGIDGTSSSALYADVPNVLVHEHGQSSKMGYWYESAFLSATGHKTRWNKFTRILLSLLQWFDRITAKKENWLPHVQIIFSHNFVCRWHMPTGSNKISSAKVDWILWIILSWVLPIFQPEKIKDFGIFQKTCWSFYSKTCDTKRECYWICPINQILGRNDYKSEIVCFLAKKWLGKFLSFFKFDSERITQTIRTGIDAFVIH